MFNKLIEKQYVTKNQKRCFMDKLFLGTRIWFYVRMFTFFWKCSKESRTRGLSAVRFAKYGHDILHSAEICGAYVNIENLEALEKVEGPIVIVGNHMSLLETVTIPSFICPIHDITFVVKDNLIKLPVFGHIMKAIKAITIARTNARDDFKVVMTQGKKLLKEGRSVVIFPQSTRSVDFSPEQFNSIAVKLAKSAKVPIIPLALKTDFLQNGTIFKDFGPIDRSKKIYFHFGEPMMVDGSGKEEHKKIVEFIQGKLKEFA